MHYTVKQKLMAFGKQYRAFDAVGNQMFEVSSMLFSPERRKEVLDMAGNMLAWSEWPVMSAHTELSCRDSTLALEIPFMSLSPEWTGTDGSGNSVSVMGDFFRRSFTVSVGGVEVAGIEKRFLSFSDTYELDVDEAQFRPEFVMLIVAMIDHKYHSDNG